MSVGLIPAVILFVWLLGLIGNAVWAVSTVAGAVARLVRGDRKAGRERLTVGAGLVVMLVINGLIFFLLVERWVKT